MSLFGHYAPAHSWLGEIQVVLVTVTNWLSAREADHSSSVNSSLASWLCVEIVDGFSASFASFLLLIFSPIPSPFMILIKLFRHLVVEVRHTIINGFHCILGRVGIDTDAGNGGEESNQSESLEVLAGEIRVLLSLEDNFVLVRVFVVELSFSNVHLFLIYY